jgi:hypothetical protein
MGTIPARGQTLIRDTFRWNEHGFFQRVDEVKAVIVAWLHERALEGREIVGCGMASFSYAGAYLERVVTGALPAHCCAALAELGYTIMFNDPDDREEFCANMPSGALGMQLEATLRGESATARRGRAPTNAAELAT